jgi:hypothetical protein
MIRRGLLCVALLFASPALPLPEQAAAPSDTQSETKSDDTPEQPESQTESTPPESALAASLPPLHMDCVPAQRAHTLVGKNGCVSGRISRIVFTHKGNTRLYLCPKDQCPFHATVYAEDVEKVGSLLGLRGRFVAIDGEVRLYRGVPEIKIVDRDQISVTAGGSHESDIPSPGTIREKRKRQLPTEKVR